MILGGRFPLLVILVFGLIVAATKGVPWVLKQMREPIPEFRVDDVRNMRYVAPYDQWPETSDEHYPATIHVHGPVESAEYASGVHPLFFERIPLKPTSVIEAKADEVVALPDGRRLSIGAILMVPSNRPAGALRDIPFDQVYYHPAGRWMTTEEAEEFRTRHGMRGSAYEWNSFNAGPAWNVEVQFETDVVLGDFVELSLRDLATGGLESRHDDLPTSQLSEDPGLISQVFPWAAIRPSPLAVHALVWQGEATTLDMPPIAPQLLTWDNDGIRLHTVVYKRDAATPEVILSGGGGLPFPGGPWGAILGPLPGILPPANTPRVGLMFGEVPKQVRSIGVRLKNGERLKPVLEYGRNTLVFDCDHDAIEAVEINIQSETAHVVFKLPELPGFPDKNRNVTDVRDMVFPTTLLPANVEIKDMISYALQMEYYGATGYGSKGSLVGSGGLPSNVRSLSGMTVRDVLNLELSRYREFEIYHSNPTLIESYMQLAEPGTLRREFDPVRTALYGFFSDTWLLLFVSASILALIKAWLLLRARDLHRLLRVRGYTDWSIWDAERAYLGLGKRAWNIPSMDELGAIPGVDATDVRSVVRFLGSVKENE